MENKLFFDKASHQVASRISYQEIYKKYASVAEIFTLPQWQAISLYYGEGLTQEAAARKLEIDRRTLSSRLKRARQKLIAHQKMLRTEHFVLLRSEVEHD